MKKSININSGTVTIVGTVNTLNTPFGKVLISPTNVGTASVSTVTDEEFKKRMSKAAKEDLFSPPENYGQHNQ